MGEYRNIFMSLKNVIVCFFPQNAAELFCFMLLEIENLFKSWRNQEVTKRKAKVNFETNKRVEF
jgi:hypothetical protein